MLEHHQPDATLGAIEGLLELEARHARRLRRGYILALALIAALVCAGLAIVQVVLARQRSDAHLINVAGRQRMLSQKLSKLALAVQVAPDRASKRELAHELAAVAAEWSDAHERLQTRAAGSRLAGVNSPSTRGRFADLDGDFAAILSAANALTAAADAASAGQRAGDDPALLAAVRTILAHEPAFLAKMEGLVAGLDREANQRTEQLGQIERGLVLLTLLTLLLEALLIFRPALARLDATRERLRDALLALAARESAVTDIATHERERIGRDIHDGLCQHLAGLRLLLDTALRRARRGGELELAALEPALPILDGALAESRQLARTLLPRAIEDQGLEACLADLAKLTSALYRVSCTCVVTRPALEMTQETAAHIYRIAQEAAANAARHGRARALHIELDGALLTVRDDGCGFDTGARHRGLGLLTMQHRARLIGGELTITSTPRGTTLSCRIGGLTEASEDA